MGEKKLFNLRKLITGGFKKESKVNKPLSVKKITIASIIGGTLILGTAYADSGDDRLSNVYHVYVDQE
ncbi:hypothetical protein, partial [Catellatospora coxensis]|uniref:hypothetical protein n=1 Tax=Catellatospora coxensis TaxID=310354 RepID=UPI0031DD0334